MEAGTSEIPSGYLCSFCFLCGKEFDVFTLESHDCSADTENLQLIEVDDTPSDCAANNLSIKRITATSKNDEDIILSECTKANNDLAATTAPNFSESAEAVIIIDDGDNVSEAEKDDKQSEIGKNDVAQNAAAPNLMANEHNLNISETTKENDHVVNSKNYLAAATAPNLSESTEVVIISDDDDDINPSEATKDDNQSEIGKNYVAAAPNFSQIKNGLNLNISETTKEADHDVNSKNYLAKVTAAPAPNLSNLPKATTLNNPSLQIDSTKPISQDRCTDLPENDSSTTIQPVTPSISNIDLPTNSLPNASDQNLQTPSIPPVYTNLPRIRVSDFAKEANWITADEVETRKDAAGQINGNHLKSDPNGDLTKKSDASVESARNEANTPDDFNKWYTELSELIGTDAEATPKVPEQVQIPTDSKSRSKPKRPSYCEFCGIRFNGPNKIPHRRPHQGQCFLCLICGEPFKNTAELMFHYKMNHYKSDVRQAELKHLHETNNDDWLYFCKQCGLGFQFVHDLMEHTEKSILAGDHILMANLKPIFSDKNLGEKSQETLTAVNDKADDDRWAKRRRRRHRNNTKRKADAKAEALSKEPNNQETKNSFQDVSLNIVSCALCGIPIENNALLVHYSMRHQVPSSFGKPVQGETTIPGRSILNPSINLPRQVKTTHNKEIGQTLNGPKHISSPILNVERKIDKTKHKHKGSDGGGVSKDVSQLADATFAQPGISSLNNREGKRKRRDSLTKKVSDNPTKKSCIKPKIIQDENIRISKETSTKFKDDGKSSRKSNFSEKKTKEHVKTKGSDTPLKIKSNNSKKLTDRRPTFQEINNKNRDSAAKGAICNQANTTTAEQQKNVTLQEFSNVAASCDKAQKIKPLTSDGRPKKILTLEQYKRRFSSTRSSTDSDPRSTDCHPTQDDSPDKQHAESTTSTPTDTTLPSNKDIAKDVVTPIYGPKEMSIINDVNHQLTLYNAQISSGNAQFSEDSDTDEVVNNGTAPSLFCEACGQSTPTTNVLKDHMKQFHNGFSFKCFVCDVACLTLDSLVAHQAKYSKATIQSAESQFLRQRKSTPNQRYPYYCNFCGGGFILINIIVKHKREELCRRMRELKARQQEDHEKIDGDDAKINGGGDGAKANDFDSSLDENQSKCDKLDDFLREGCEANNTSPEALVTPETIAEQFLEYCEVCGQKHASLADKQKHFHLNSFDCVICRRGFDQLEQLTAHYDDSHPKLEVLRLERTETSILNRHKYFCVFCGMGFYFISELLSHKEADHYELIHKIVAEENDKSEDGGREASRANEETVARDVFSNKGSDHASILASTFEASTAIPGLDIDGGGKETIEAQNTNTNANEKAMANNVFTNKEQHHDANNLARIFEAPNIIPGLDIGGGENEKIEAQNSNTNRNEKAMANNVFTNKEQDLDASNLAGIFEAPNVIPGLDIGGGENEKIEAQNTNTIDAAAVDNPIYISDSDSNDGYSVVEVSDRSCSKSPNMDIHEYLRLENVKLDEAPDISDKWDEAAQQLTELTDLLTNEASLEDACEPADTTNTLPVNYIEPQIFCEACGREFTGEAAMRSHFTASHEEKYFRCSSCGRCYENVASLIQHQDCSHDVDFVKHSEKYAFPTSHSHNVTFKYYCKMCGKGYDHIFDLKDHNSLICFRHVSSQDSCESSIVPATVDVPTPKPVVVTKCTATKRKKKTGISCPVCSQYFDYWYQLNEHRITQCEFKSLPNTEQVLTSEAAGAPPAAGADCTVSTTTEIQGNAEPATNPAPLDNATETNEPVQLPIIDQTSLPPPVSGEVIPDKNKRIRCPVCPNKFFGYQVDFQQHLMHSGKHQKYLDRAKAKFHYALLKVKLEEAQYTCDYCSKSFTKEYQLSYHLKTKHKGDPPFRCKHCAKCFKTKLKLALHSAQCHVLLKNEKESFQCDTCQKILGSKQGLVTHTKRHLKLYNIKCEFCGKGFFCSGSLKLHLNSKHTGKSNFICGICDRPCYDKTALKNHIEKHKADYKTRSKVKCEECDQEFLDKKYLRIHQKKKHVLDNRFVCDHCGKKLYSKSGLTDHMNIHQGLKPHKCELCGVGFANSTTLRLHNRRHTGERPYKCTLCERAFTQSHSLKVHLRLHTGEKPFTCSICGKGFVSTSILRSHMKCNHKLD